jgi:hypothetical protein
MIKMQKLNLEEIMHKKSHFSNISKTPTDIGQSQGNQWVKGIKLAGN